MCWRCSPRPTWQALSHINSAYAAPRDTVRSGRTFNLASSYTDPVCCRLHKTSDMHAVRAKSQLSSCIRCRNDDHGRIGPRCKSPMPEFGQR